MARITIDVDLPPEVEITGYQRYQDAVMVVCAIPHFSPI